MQGNPVLDDNIARELRESQEMLFKKILHDLKILCHKAAWSGSARHCLCLYVIPLSMCHLPKT